MRAAILVAMGLLLAVAAGATTVAGSEDVGWFRGEVQEAFRTAQEQDRPLFLYWGAVWCPPCNQIKKTIFTRREFVEKMKLFVPVYLDGDTETAQVWGEKLKASGYPTMIVLGPDGAEIARVPTGLQLEQFLEVLDQALGETRSVAAVLDAVLAAPEASAVPGSTWTLLSYSSWGSDESLGRSEADLERDLRRLEGRVPPGLAPERSRLFLRWLDSRIALAGSAAPARPPLDPAEADRIQSRLVAILADEGLTLANLQFLTYSSREVLELLHPGKSPARTALIVAWERAMERIETDPALSVDERLSALLPALTFEQMSRPKGDLPEAFRERVRSRVAWADAQASDAYTRQAAMSTAAHLLDEVGETERARELLLAQLEKAPSPHYFMSTLASLAKKAGDRRGALEWMRKAYEASPGRASRFQWGSSYLIGLVELSPQDDQGIRREVGRILGEMLGFDDAFAGRNRGRQARLTKAFAGWNEGGRHARTVAAIRDDMLARCAALGDRAEAEGGSQRERCLEFFEALGAGPVAKR